ncbi:hypothetical protein E2562_028594 [Oryza meyeriana var. granulata]|uniref:Uncharacterized protein n=1 Tax=Oryza meyeriana var. granulata TaxID=110450 RepID=A0A6G1D904_9ORYZ|nr:hypothetical protein E2562_028594 [Oryza meyeriana var. granulata]
MGRATETAHVVVASGRCMGRFGLTAQEAGGRTRSGTDLRAWPEIGPPDLTPEVWKIDKWVHGPAGRGSLTRGANEPVHRISFD